ncbi:MAG: methyltransferase domain-containing protein [Candidatus Thorarchaeota archaeon]
MKHITVVIPTRGRCESLLRTLDNIPREDYIDIQIACDGDQNTYERVLERQKTDLAITRVELLPGHNGSVFCRNYLIKDVSDGLLYATDDILFEKGAIQRAFEFFNQEFPDDDGVVGFIEDLPNYCKTAVGLVGQQFLLRYPEKKLFYPRYFHFACQEIERLVDVVELQKHVFATRDDLRLSHAHPSVDKKYLDQTHRDARKYAKRDHNLSRERRAEGLIWGYNDMDVSEDSFNSSEYWEVRYRNKGTSGKGSYGKLAIFKSEVINNFIKKHNIRSVIDFGCGDGNQASFINCENYIGYDVSRTVVERCRERFKGDRSKTFTDSVEGLEKADLTLSCEVIFHLVEFSKFAEHLQQLFTFSKRYVIIFSSNEYTRIPQPRHVKHREFTSYVSECFPEWKLIRKILNKYPKECFSDFFIYEKKQ